MVRTVALLLLALAAAGGGHTEPWRFVSMADSRGSDNGVNTTVLSQIVSLINTEDCDLVIFAGDAVTGSSNNATLDSQLNTWKSIMDELTCPYYPVVGNHEIQSPTSHLIFISKFVLPTNGPPGLEELVFSFDHENAHFVGLDSNVWGDFHRVQTDWLDADLAATEKPHVFTYGHEPAYPVGPHVGSSLDVYPAERDYFWSVLSSWDTGPYFCGHEHLYNRQLRGQVYQVINGTCGAPIHTGYGGDFYHYVVVEVDGFTVELTCKDWLGAVRDNFSYTIGVTSRSPTGWLVPGWNQVSIPLLPEDAEASAVFDDLAALGNVLENHIFTYEPGSGYGVYPGDFTQIERGRSYWLKLDYGGTETLLGVEAKVAVEIELAEGWNFIGYPFRLPQLWANCEVTDGVETKTVEEAGLAGWIQTTMYSYKPGVGYRLVTPDASGDDRYLRAWLGYWLRVYQPGLKLIVRRP